MITSLTQDGKQSWPIFFGPLDRKKFSRVELLAYETFCTQKKKCNNPNDPMYKNYGAKGIKVYYSVREFIGWYVLNAQFFNGEKLSVGRIDHDKGYFFENIMVQEMAENSRESAIRNNLCRFGFERKKELIAFDPIKKEEIKSFASIREAARFYGVSQRLIQFLVRGKYKSSKKIPVLFKYKGE